MKIFNEFIKQLISYNYYLELLLSKNLSSIFKSIKNVISKYYYIYLIEAAKIITTDCFVYYCLLI